MLARLAAEELPKAHDADDAVKRVKRRLHQAVGAFRGDLTSGELAAVGERWHGDLTDPHVRAACAEVMRSHASTRERLPYVDTLYTGIWHITGVPATLLDIGCGLNPLALPWMAIGGATYMATDADARPVATVETFLELVGQPHTARTLDAVTEVPHDPADVALLLKLVTTLDRQDPRAAARLIGGLQVRHAVVSFPIRSLGGRAKGMERTYRQRVDELVSGTGRVVAVAEASVPNELVFVLTLDG